MDYSLIIKITNRCNLNCSYCYHRHDLSRNFECSMSRDLIAQMIEGILQHNEHHAEFIWHGGEPLLMGLDTYRFIIEKQKEYNVKKLQIVNTVQTNGTMLTDEYIRFCAENDIHIGVSIDGPFDLHASQRNTDAAEYSSIMKAIDRLNNAQVRHGVLCVIGNQHVGQADRLFEMFREHGIRQVAFLPCLVQENGVMDHDLTINPKDYGQFLIDFFEQWIHGDVHGMCVRNFDDCIRFYRGKPLKTCINTNSCDRYLTVMPDGKLYLCDNFSSNDEHCVGSVQVGFDSIDTTAPMRWLKSTLTLTPPSCTKCEYFAGCQSGCKYRRWVNDPAMNAGHYYCLSTKMLYHHIGQYLRQEE